jgi:hypothetical protein
VQPDDRALVAGELRGYRQFFLEPDGLLPLVHRASGAWDGRLEHAVCAVGEDHPAPAAGCRCGLYAWYLPGSATVCLGAWNAVVAARGRVVLGDRGFRAAAARVEAVALPAAVRCWPPAAHRARGVLAERYPAAQVYGSTRAMLRAHPPADLSALGVVPPRDRSRLYRAALALLFVTFVVAGYALVLVPHDVRTRVAQEWWPLVLLVLVGWQAALIWLVTRLLRGQDSSVDSRPPAT